MEPNTLSLADLHGLLKPYDIHEFVQYIDTKGTLPENEREHIKSLGTKQDVVAHLHRLLRADSYKLDVFLDEYYLFASECLTNVLRVTLELKKRKLSRGNRSAQASSDSKQNEHTSPTSFGAFCYLGTSQQEALDQGGSVGTQETGYQSIFFPSAFSLPSDIPEVLSVNSQTETSSAQGQPAATASPQTKQTHTSGANVAGNVTSHCHRRSQSAIEERAFPFCKPWPLSFQAIPLQITMRRRNSMRQSSCDYQRKTKLFKELIRKHNNELLKHINVSSLLPLLQREQLLNSNEFDQLLDPQKTNREKKQLLLSILPTKGEKAYEKFLYCLSHDTGHTGHASLLKLFTRENPSSMVSYV